VSKYRDWLLMDTLPDGWVIDRTAGSPLSGYVFITNGKSVLNGQQRALLNICDSLPSLRRTEQLNFDIFLNNQKLLTSAILLKKNRIRD